MKRTFLLTLCILLLFNTVICVAEEMEARASSVLISGSVICTSTMYTQFSASLKIECETIYVSSVVLQKKSGSSWQTIKSLTAPSDIVSNDKQFRAYANYNDSYESGIYRLKAVFNADGYEKTYYSNQVTF